MKTKGNQNKHIDSLSYYLQPHLITTSSRIIILLLPNIVQMNLSDYRKEFPIFSHSIYLNSCSLGALSVRSREYVQSFLKEWDNYGASAWYSTWLNELESVRILIARLLNADHREIALGHSISTLLGTIASSIDFTDRKRVVVSELDFPTANYQWLARKQWGVETGVILSSDGIQIPKEDFEQAMNGQTALVSTSHVFYRTGHIQDIASIQNFSSSKGALCLIDAYQSTGQVPVDVKSMRIDMLVSGGLKWLLGGPGIAFLFVRQELIDTLEPAAAGWFGSKNQFEFIPDRIDFHDSALRFETGTPSMASVYALKGGLEVILEIGVDAIRKATQNLTEELINMLKRAGFTLNISPHANDRSAIVMIEFENAGKAVAALKKQNIIVDYRHDYTRVSPYFYNTSDDLNTFVNVLTAL